MSTIHDALKKVQDDMGPEAQNKNPDEQAPSKPHNPFNAPTPPPEEPPTTEDQEGSEDPKKRSQKIIGIIFLVIIIAGLGLAIYLLTNTGSEMMATFNKFKNGKLPSTITEHTQMPTFRSSNEMRLKGIMTIGNKRVALFGDEIYELHDKINEKQIIAISTKDITVVNDLGVEEVIKVSK